MDAVSVGNFFKKWIIYSFLNTVTQDVRQSSELCEYD